MEFILPNHSLISSANMVSADCYVCIPFVEQRMLHEVLAACISRILKPPTHGKRRVAVLLSNHESTAALTRVFSTKNILKIE